MRGDGGWAPEPGQAPSCRYQAAGQSGRPRGRSFPAPYEWGYAFFPPPALWSPGVWASEDSRGPAVEGGPGGRDLVCAA